MAEQIIIDIQLDKGSVNADLQATLKNIKDLKEEQKALNKIIKEGNDVNGEASARLLDVGKELAYNQTQAKGLSATQRLLNSETKQYTNTLNGQRQKLADMQSAYDAMDASMRNSEGGRAFLAQIKAQHEAVLELEGGTGRMQRNVGNYTEAITKAIPSLGGFGKTLEGLGISFNGFGNSAMGATATASGGIKAFGKALITPPFGLITIILSAIVKAFKSLQDALGKNDSAMTQLQSSFAIFKPLAQATTKTIQAVADVCGKVASAVANLALKIANVLNPAFAESAKKAMELVIAQDNLEEAMRQQVVANAKSAQEVAKWRAIASESTDLEERKSALEKAIALEEEIAKRNVEIAQEKLRIRKEVAKQEVDTSDETTNEIAQLEAEAINAETEYYNKKREMATQIRELDARINAERQKQHQEYLKKIEERRKAEEEAERKRLETLKDAMSKEKEISEMLEDFKVKLIKDEGVRELAEMRLNGERELNALNEKLATEKNLTEEAKAQLFELITLKEEELQRQLQEKADVLAEEKLNAELERERERQQRILELKIELAEEGSQEELELKLQQLDEQLAMELENTELSEEEKYLIKKKYEQLKYDLMKENADAELKMQDDLKKKMSESLLKTASVASSAFGQMSDMLAKYGEENEKAKKASKAFALMQLATDQAVSISQTARAMVEAVQGATQAASATGPLAPVMLAVYIAEMVGLVLGAVAGQVSSIMQAKNILNGSDKYAVGGVVGGTSYSGDKLTAKVNSGEMILNREQQTNLFKMANVGGGFDYSGFAEAVAQAVASQPAPILEYTEFESFANRVTKVRELSKL